MKKSLQLSMDLYYIGMILYICGMKPCMILYIYGMKPYHICIKSYGVKLCLTEKQSENSVEPEIHIKKLLLSMPTFVLS